MIKALTYSDRARMPEQSVSGYVGWRSANFIQVSGAVVVNVGRTRPKRERDAINWLFFYALREALTAEALVKLLGVEASEIRAAFTRPEAEVGGLVEKIEKVRARMDAALREPADVEVHRLARRGCRLALETHAMVEVIVKTREGKTMTADWFNLTHLHNSVYVYCRHEKNERDFIWSFAKAHGLAVGNGSTLSQLRQQIRSMYGRGGLELLILDEGHNLWPKQIVKDDPTRIEFIRSIWDENSGDMGIVSFSTPQSAIAMNLALKFNERWAPGQYSGRVITLKSKPERSDADFRNVARWHCPEGTDAMIQQLALFAKVSDGLFGSMVNVLKVARFDARDERRPLGLEHIKAAQLEAIAGTDLEKKLREKGVINERHQ